jgi:hypothetical protein
MRPQIKDVVAELMPAADDSVVVDFESFYNDRCTVKKLGNWAYTHHEEFDAYLVTVFGRGIEFVGHPADFDWALIDGRPWCAHNAGFDKSVFERLQEQGAIPRHVGPRNGVWRCTADLSAYFGYGRSLADVSRQLFGIELTKEVRDSTMKGKYWFQFSDAEKKSVTDYAADDAIAWCVWQKLGPQWPQIEQDLSWHTIMSGSRGVRVDLERVDADIQVLNTAKWRLECDIPWIGEEDEKGKPYKLGSPRALKAECEKAGVPVPETTSVKEQSFLDWLDEFGELVPAVEALTKWRRVNRLLETYKTLRARLRPDGTVESSLKYYGAAATGRWAGTSGLNFQNWMKEPLRFDAEHRYVDWVGGEEPAYKVDIRACFIPREGKKMIVADLSQIEPRILNWFVGNEEFTKLLRSGMGPYEAHARAFMGWTGGNLKKENPKLYALAKARVLALGYAAGWRKFIQMAATYVGPEAFKIIFEAPVTEEQETDFLRYLHYLVEKMAHKDSRRDLRIWRSGELTREEKNVWVNSWLQVQSFRESNPLLAKKQTGLWDSLNNAFRASAVDGHYEIELPEGRKLFYFDVSSNWGWSARRVRGGKPERCYGGLIAENITQAMARSCFAPGILRLEAAGMHVLFHVHDEVIVEVDPHVTPDDVVKLLCVTPEWAAGLPMAAEAEEVPHYKK